MTREQQEHFLKEFVDGKTIINETIGGVPNFAIDLGNESLEDYKRRKGLLTQEEFNNKIISLFANR